MQALPLGRLGLAQTAVVSSLTLIAVALLGLVLAYWTWIWFAPRAEPRLETPTTQSTDASSANALFGIVPRSQNAAAPTGIAIRLLGVVAASGGRRGYGVVQLDAKQILAVHEGDDVAPGIRLAEVLTDRLILERGGLRETLAWPEKKTAAPPATQTAESPAPQPAQPTAPQAAQPPVAPQPVQPAPRRSRGSAGRANDSD